MGMGERTVLPARIHECPVVRLRGTEQPVSAGVQQPELARRDRGDRPYALEHPPAEIVEDDDTALVPGGIEHRSAEPDHRLERLLDLSMLDIEIEGRNVDLVFSELQAVANVVTIDLVLQPVPGNDRRMAVVPVDAHPFPAIEIDEAYLVVDLFLLGEREIVRAYLPPCDGISGRQPAPKQLLMREITHVGQACGQLRDRLLTADRYELFGVRPGNRVNRRDLHVKQQVHDDSRHDAQRHENDHGLPQNLEDPGPASAVRTKLPVA